jgi:hypothetical protein
MEERIQFAQMVANPTTFKILQFFFDGKDGDAPMRMELIEKLPGISRAVVDASLAKLREMKVLRSERNEKNNVFYIVEPAIDDWKFQILHLLFEGCN